jgi:hypothetical protein
MDFSAAFNIKYLWKLFKANWSGFLIAFLIIIGGSIILYYGSYFLVLTVILCLLYPFVISAMTAYLGLVGSALFAEAYRRGITNLASEYEG